MNNEKKAERKERNRERQLFQQQTEPEPKQTQQPRQKQKQQQKQPEEAPFKQKEKTSLGSFIGRQNLEGPPIEALPVDATSVACSALTTPSGLYEGSTVSGASSRHVSEDEPLLQNNMTRDGKRDKRVAFSGGNSNNKYQPRNGNNQRSNNNNNSGGSSHHEPTLRKNKGKKKPWFSSSSSYAKTNNNSNGRSYDPAISRIRTTTAVQYRSAASTQRALEELKRKRLETQEKRRAVTVLALLFVVAVTVHFAGGSWSGLLGMKNTTKAGVNDATLRGSRDKVYGETKDLGYGGERAGLPIVQPEGGALAEGATSAGGNPYDEPNYEYKLPPPTEKTYDPAHEFLLPLRHFADVSDPNRASDTAYFFHVPRAGGSTMKEIIGKCLTLVQSSDVGVRDGHGTDPVLAVLEVGNSKYVNVDTTTIPGIQRAVDLGLSNSGLANVVISSYFHESAALFDLTHQGRAFILLRDPIVRATSMYWHRIKEVGDLDLTTTIEDYAQGNGIENNWMCRFLANWMTGELTKDDLEQAKMILKDKFLIGFLDDLEESVYRIMKFNGWTFLEDETKKMREEDCIKDLSVEEGGSNVNPHEYEIPKRGSQAHALISWQTQFDTKLYGYARELFESQTKEWGTKERKKALKKEKKKKAGGGVEEEMYIT